MLMDCELSFSGKEESWGGTNIGSDGKNVCSIIILSLGEGFFGVVSTQSNDVNNGVNVESIEMEALQTEPQLEPEEQLHDTVRI